MLYLGNVNYRVMKILYKVLILIGLISIVGKSYCADSDTLVVVKVVAVDTNNLGYFNAIEIEFNQPVDDATENDTEWHFSNNSDMSDNVAGNNFDTKVEYITSSTLSNDKFIRIGINDGPNKINDNTYDTIFINYNGGEDFLVTFLSLILLIGWEVLNETITASVGESGIIIQIIKGYGSYARFKFLVNLEPLNREPVNR